MTAPIGLQLYSLRDTLAIDFPGTISKVAAMGYTGVETAGFPVNMTPKEVKKIFDELGLKVTSSHSPLPLGDDKNRVLDNLSAIACPHLVSAWMSPDYYESRDSMKELAEIFNQAYEIVVDNGMEFSIHNHDFEFRLIDGTPAINILKGFLQPGINFELDTYWIQVAGLDPSVVVAEMGDRAPLLHLKDGPATKEADMTAVGEGVLNVPAIVNAGASNTEWLIVELDRCATDMLEAVEKSYRYLSGLTG
jgi:sugar phosphate isomerase/epimerase